MVGTKRLLGAHLFVNCGLVVGTKKFLGTHPFVNCTLVGPLVFWDLCRPMRLETLAARPFEKKQPPLRTTAGTETPQREPQPPKESPKESLKTLKPGTPLTSLQQSGSPPFFPGGRLTGPGGRLTGPGGRLTGPGGRLPALRRPPGPNEGDLPQAALGQKTRHNMNSGCATIPPRLGKRPVLNSARSLASALPLAMIPPRLGKGPGMS